MFKRRYIHWKPQYETGHPVLDAQHKQIVDIINELFDAILQGDDRAALRPMLDRLVDCTQRHFEYEEQLLDDLGDPNAQQQKAAYGEMREKTAEVRDELSPSTGRDLLGFLKKWWVHHIRAQDEHVSPCLEVAANA